MVATTFMALRWGTVPDWVAGIGTAGGLIYALLLFRRESQARHSQEEDRLREQARYVAAWIDDAGKLTVRNGSQEPVYDVRIYHSREEGYDDRLPVLFETELLRPLAEVETDEAVPRPMGVTMFRLEFVDARGIRWVRESGGTLIRLPPSIDVGKVGAMAAIDKATRGSLYTPHYRS